MTVCIAAICDEGNRIYCASDRMFTKGDTEYEHEHSKVWKFSSQIIAMVAGNVSIQNEILLEVNKRIEGRENEISLQEVAYLYSEEFTKLRVKRAALRYAEATRVVAEGADAQQQASLSRDLVALLSEHRLDQDDIQTIIAGFDKSGPHLWAVTNGEPSCVDVAAYATIGAGEFLAESVLIFSGHSRKQSAGKTLYAVYGAKKRAEHAPGVGQDYTDLYVIGPKKKRVRRVPGKLQDVIEEMWQSNFNRTQASWNETDKECQSYVRKYER
jgi:hypothetical protein